jgi:hypothetical protein
MSSFCTVRFQIISSSRVRDFLRIESLPRYNRFSTATDSLWQWEKGVLELLKSTHDQEMIRKICRLPFRDRNTLQDMLSQRWDLELDRHLMSLRVEFRDHRDEIFDWPRDRKAKEFLRQVLQTRKKHTRVWCREWDVLACVRSRSPSQAADIVSDFINTAVTNVDFREWAGCAFGYDGHGVTSCLNGVEHTRFLLRQQLQKLDQLKTKCESVEKVSSIRNFSGGKILTISTGVALPRSFGMLAF